jgi:hypothetical protein
MKRTQWNKLGDHPAVKQPTQPNLLPVAGMRNCGIILIDGEEVLVREGDWITEYDDGKIGIERSYDPRNPAFLQHRVGEK